MNPIKFAQMMKYLTRAKKVNPELPDVFPASKAPIPPKTQTVEEMEAINAFIRRERAQKAGGGMLVQPGFGGTRQGYAEELPANVQKNKQGNYVYRSGKGDDVIYKSGFKTPEAASKWGQKEFVKKFALPNKFVSPAELSEILDFGKGKGSGMQSPLFERGDRPRYLLQEARKILGSYQAGGSNFFRAPTKKEIEYLKKYSKAPRITEGLAKNVQIILDSKAIMNDLTGKNKGGAKLPEFNKVIQVFKNAGVNASDAQITNALQKAAYLLRGDTFQTDVKYNVDKDTGRFIIKELEKLPFDNQYARGIYKHALNEIRLELGETAGNLESFKRNLRKRLPDGFLQKHGLEINEIFSVRASAKNQSFPYAYFLDATDAELNKKALRSFHGALSKAQTDLNNKIADIRAGKAKYDEAVTIIEKFQKTRSKFKNTIETNYPGKNFNLADIVLGKESEVLKKNMKIPEDVYSKKLLDKWKNQGLDITGHAKKTGYVMTGADNPGVFTAQDLSRDKAIRDSFIKQVSVLGGGKCKTRGFLNQGGRVGLKDGTPSVDVCFRNGLERIRKGGVDFTRAEAMNFNKLTKGLRAIGASNIMKFGILPEVLFEGALIANKMATEGDSFAQGLRNSYLAVPFQAMGLAKTYEEGRRDEILAAAPESQRGKILDVMNLQDTLNKRNELVAQSQNLKSQIEDTDRISDGSFGYVGDSQDLQKKLFETRADLQDLYRGDARRAERMLTTKPIDLNIRDQLTMDAYKSAVEKADVDRASNILFAPGANLGVDTQIKKRMKDLPITPEYAKEQLKATGDFFGTGYTPFGMNELFESMGVQNPRFGYDETGQYSEEKGLNDFMNYLKNQQVADAGGVANLAGGGIAKLAGVDQGPPPESGPMSQGLQGLMKRGIKG